MAQKQNIKVMPAVEYARAHTETAIQVLADMMLGADKDSTRVSAAIAILNRGWGTPPQSLQVTGDAPKAFDMTGLTQEQLREFHRLMSIVRPADEVVDPADMPEEKDLKNVTSIVPVEKQA